MTSYFRRQQKLCMKLHLEFCVCKKDNGLLYLRVRMCSEAIFHAWSMCLASVMVRHCVSRLLKDWKRNWAENAVSSSHLWMILFLLVVCLEFTLILIVNLNLIILRLKRNCKSLAGLGLNAFLLRLNMMIASQKKIWQGWLVNTVRLFLSIIRMRIRRSRLCLISIKSKPLSIQAIHNWICIVMIKLLLTNSV